jgi:nucleoside-diphosphate-sugar epimerase
MKKILITGARGFVGGYIANQLSRDYIICSPDRHELNLIDLVTVNEWFDKNQVDAVIHCALSGREVLGSQDPQYLSDGLLMFRNLWLNRHSYTQFIHLGTAYEFDLDVNNELIKEDEFINHLPNTSYGYAKNIAARIIRDTDNFYNLRLFGNCYETENPIRFFKRIATQKEITITNDVYIDYIYMPDIIHMIQCILDGNAQHRDINMVYNTKYRLSELAHMMCDALDIDRNKIKILGSNGKNLTGDGSRLASYGFALIGIEQGIRNYK